MNPADRILSILVGVETRAFRALPPPWIDPATGAPSLMLSPLRRQVPTETVEFIAHARGDVPRLARALRIATEALRAAGGESLDAAAAGWDLPHGAAAAVSALARVAEALEAAPEPAPVEAPPA